MVKIIIYYDIMQKFPAAEHSWWQRGWEEKLDIIGIYIFLPAQRTLLGCFLNNWGPKRCPTTVPEAQSPPLSDLIVWHSRKRINSGAQWYQNNRPHSPTDFFLKPTSVVLTKILTHQCFLMWVLFLGKNRSYTHSRAQRWKQFCALRTRHESDVVYILGSFSRTH